MIDRDKANPKPPKPIKEGTILEQTDVIFLKSDSDRIWIRSAYEWLHQKIDHPTFPCPFARKSWINQSCQLLFCSALTSTGINNNFLNGLIEYATFVKDTPIEQRVLAPLIVVFQETDAQNAQEDYRYAWSTMQWLHDMDTMPWPDEIPGDPESSMWTFCFHGVQFFFNMSSRHHKILKSRNLGKHFTMVVNPRENFDLVAPATSRAGNLIRQKIRDRVSTYNGGIRPPSELGFFGTMDNLEWQQYQLEEPEIPRPSRCPLLIRR
jgi:FPC/CPF motif-containing protein YcgG